MILLLQQINNKKKFGRELLFELIAVFFSDGNNLKMTQDDLNKITGAILEKLAIINDGNFLGKLISLVYLASHFLLNYVYICEIIMFNKILLPIPQNRLSSFI